MKKGNRGAKIFLNISQVKTSSETFKLDQFSLKRERETDFLIRRKKNSWQLIVIIILEYNFIFSYKVAKIKGFIIWYCGHLWHVLVIFLAINVYSLKLLYCQPINLHVIILNNFIEYCLCNKAYIKKGPAWDWTGRDLIQN